ncbi:MAG: pyridoxamine 5'-phosphate oxidase family protein [Planctomycetota bacterium]|jgi:nitroimidazol reductase NimA-like FMN-containing flavoprotein (pyridoxamine 5'-phosphate oxidase superfamily)
MRKKDKQINDPAEIEDTLICRLAFCDNNQPYIVPLCFGHKDNALYFHCAAEGKKLDILRKNNNVCFQGDIDTEPIKAEIENMTGKQSG